VQAPPDLIIVGNAISRGHLELEAILDARLPMTSVSAFVGEHLISRNTSIVCAGTHGKTTTSSITAWILDHAQFKPGFLIGGVPHGFSNGCRPTDASVHDTRAGVFVAEGDEYDTAFFDKRSKFVHYRPTVAILNNLEYDHADIFPDLASIKRSFDQLVRIVPRNGLVLANADDTNVMDVVKNSPAPVQTLGTRPESIWQIDVVESTPLGSTWSLNGSTTLGPFRISMPGLHNVRNASMAALACIHVGVTDQEVQQALEAFAPPKRRLEHLGMWKGAHVIDDFAHHPTAIKATIQAIGQIFPDVAIHAVFEPRSNTTTRSVFQQELAECFQGASSVVIGPVHRPERFAPDDRLDTTLLVSTIASAGTSAMSIPSQRSADPRWGVDVVQWLAEKAQPGEVVLILSNGNVGGLRELLASAKPPTA
jgi:UDP-N-acetylmuramate: L-alanyl-gamma-D-glutamyl-meso-diaminopimelate ligase